MTNRQPVAIRLHPRDLAAIDNEATRLGIARTAAIEQAINLWLEKRATERLKEVAAGSKSA